MISGLFVTFFLCFSLAFFGTKYYEWAVAQKVAKKSDSFFYSQIFFIFLGAVSIQVLLGILDLSFDFSGAQHILKYLVALSAIGFAYFILKKRDAS